MINLVKKHPQFSAFDAGLVEQNLKTLLDSQRKQLRAIESETLPDWENTFVPLQVLEEELSIFWSPVRHLNAVMNSDDVRSAYNSGLEMLSEWYTDLGQNQTLYKNVQKIYENRVFSHFDGAQQKIISNALRDFRLSGVSLTGEKRERYKVIALQLSKLQSRFEENLLDCSNAWKKPISHPDALGGLPESALAMAEQYARENGQQTGWMLGLEFPLYYAVQTYATDRALREEVYTAYCTRASAQGPHDEKWLNDAIVDEILALRREKAQILGFENYAQLSTETKMVESPEAVDTFLCALVEKARPLAQIEFQQLKKFAADYDGLADLQAWDIAYYSEKQKQAHYAISDEDLKPYFPAEQVTKGLFEVVGKLYGIRIRAVQGVAVWHPDVRYFEIDDADGETRGGFYLDMYARANKRGGAWMDECVTRRKSETELQMPIAYLTCNLSPPAGDLPSLLTHDEVITLFHEFGHGLQHLLTQVDYPAVAGINGVEWDAVELPSQFLENWCWQRESLDMIGRHYQTGEKIPAALLQRAQQAKNYQSALQMLRQIEFSLFDLRLHLHAGLEKIDVQEALDNVRKQVAVVFPPAFNRFQNSFSHIFAGGYAAGYFSYKWAEVLSSDAFSRFEEEGIFNSQTGSEFMQTVLEQGGTRPAQEIFEAFRGRPPQIDALLRHSGLAA